MALNQKVVRSSEKIKRGLLKKAFKGNSQYDVDEMLQKISEAKERIKNTPSAEEVLGNVYTRLSGKENAPSVEEVNNAMEGSDSRALRKFNMMSLLERSENGQFEALKDNKDELASKKDESNDNQSKQALSQRSLKR